MKVNFGVIILVLGLFHYGDAQCFDVSRSGWGARPPRGTSGIGSRQRAFVHHSAGGRCTSQSTCASTVRSIQNFHMDSNGWNDIGYNFLIGEDGLVYEGRGWHNLGAHTGGCNTGSVGICVMGTFTGALPNQSALNRLHNFISCARSNNMLPAHYRVHGHRNHGSTECPGQTFYNWLTSRSDFNAATTC